jgi:hypothetical protein
MLYFYHVLGIMSRPGAPRGAGYFPERCKIENPVTVPAKRRTLPRWGRRKQRVVLLTVQQLFRSCLAQFFLVMLLRRKTASV